MASRQHAGFKSAGDFWRRKYEAERTAVNALRDDFVKAACEWYVESQAVEYDAGISTETVDRFLADNPEETEEEDAEKGGAK